MRRRFVHVDRLTESTLITSCDLKARVTIPFLRRFKANWATEAYLCRSLRNQKGYLKRKAAGIDTDGTNSNGPGLEEGEESSLDEMDDE